MLYQSISVTIQWILMKFGKRKIDNTILTKYKYGLIRVNKNCTSLFISLTLHQGKTWFIKTSDITLNNCYILQWNKSCRSLQSENKILVLFLFIANNSFYLNYANFLFESYGQRRGTRPRCLRKIKIEEKLLTHKFASIFFCSPPPSPKKKSCWWCPCWGLKQLWCCAGWWSL